MQERLQRLQQSMTDHLRTVAHVQTMVEYIAIVLVSVYAAHLWDMIEPHIHWKWLHEIVWRMPRGSWGVLLLPWLRAASRRSCSNSGVIASTTRAMILLCVLSMEGIRRILAAFCKREDDIMWYGAPYLYVVEPLTPTAFFPRLLMSNMA